jgi:hypothetical protein
VELAEDKTDDGEGNLSFDEKHRRKHLAVVEAIQPAETKGGHPGRY